MSQFSEHRSTSDKVKDALHIGHKREHTIDNPDYTKDHLSTPTSSTAMTSTSTIAETVVQPTSSHIIQEEALLTLPAHSATGELLVDNAMSTARVEIPEHAAPAKFVIPAHEEHEILSVPSHQTAAQLVVPDFVAAGSAVIKEHVAPAQVSISGGQGTGDVAIAGFQQTVPISLPAKVGSAMVAVEGTQAVTQVKTESMVREACMMVPAKEEVTSLHVAPSTQTSSVLVPEQQLTVTLPGCANQVLNVKIPAHSRPEVISTSGVNLTGRVVIPEHMEQAAVAMAETRQEAYVNVAPHTVAAAVTVPETATNAFLEVAPTTVPANLLVSNTESSGQVLFNEQIESASLAVGAVTESVGVNVAPAASIKSRTVGAVETDTVTAVPAQIMETNVAIPARAQQVSVDVPAEQAIIDVAAREEGFLSSQLQNVGIQQIGESEMACVPSVQTVEAMPAEPVAAVAPAMIETTQVIQETEISNTEVKDHHHIGYASPRLVDSAHSGHHGSDFSDSSMNYGSSSGSGFIDNGTTGDMHKKKSFSQKLKEKLHIGGRHNA
eukprot:GILK01014032.1.p1 GENE.GILK01014032.1~~GILK01014032.1.p1  ORF type:complete len:551 (-),score=144.17 GILK01014032.1:319-1971(-)